MSAWRCEPNDDATSVVGDGRDHDVLASLGWAGYLTTSQIASLHFPSTRVAQRRLRALFDHRLTRRALQSEALHRDMLHGLSRVAAERLEEQGTDARVCAFPRAHKLRHALAVRDVFVAFMLAERRAWLAVDGFAFEWDMARREPFRSARLIPDALVRARRDEIVVDVLIEVDLGTEPRSVWKEKLDSYERIFRSTENALLVLVGAGARRETGIRTLVECRLGGRASVLPLLGTHDALRDGYPFGVSARGVQTERTVRAPELRGFRPVSAPAVPPFRPR